MCNHISVFIGWFGIRKDFCEFLLGTCTFLQEYGNISCKFSESVFSRPSGDETSIEPQRKPILHEYPAKCVVPVVSIEMPDWWWTCALCIQQLQLSTKPSWCQWTGISKMKKAKPPMRGELNWEKLLRDDSLLYGTRPTSFALKFRNGRMLNATRKNAWNIPWKTLEKILERRQARKRKDAMNKWKSERKT